MSLVALLEWWNLIYIVPFGLALLYLGVFVFTGITFGDADADADMDMGSGGDVHVEAHVVEGGAEVAHGADHDVGHEVHGDHDAEANGRALAHDHMMHGHSADDGAHTPSLMNDFLSFLGLGKIPISLAVMILMLFWGVFGFGINVLLMRWLGSSNLVGLISVPVTLAISMGLTGACAAVIGKVIPIADTKRQRREDLVGQLGDAMYDIDSTFGMASVRGVSGDLFQVPCKTANGGKIPKGSRVVLFEYDREKGVFHVAPFAA